MQTNQKRPNHPAHSKQDNKSRVLDQKKTDGNIEANNHIRSWATALKYERISRSIARMFLGKDKEILKAVI